MAPFDKCLATMAKLSMAQPLRPAVSTIPRFLAPALMQTRSATVIRIKKEKKKSAQPKDFKRHNLAKRTMPQYTLCEAMRVLRASEVGQPPASIKYELHINLKTMRNGPVVRGTIRLPNPVQSDWQIAVICPEGSDVAAAAVSAGAVAVGEESLFEAIRSERFDFFDRLICHESSERALSQANLGRILGPRGLMPNHRQRTIVSDVARSIRDSAGAADYRERQGVIRLAIGQLAHSPEQVKANIQAVLARIKSECGEIAEESMKEVHEVIISSTNGPALSLSGKMRDAETEIEEAALATVM